MVCDCGSLWHRKPLRPTDAQRLNDLFSLLSIHGARPRPLEDTKARKNMLQETHKPRDGQFSLSEAAKHLSSELQRRSLEPFALVCGMICIDLPVFSLAFWFAQYGASPTENFEPFGAAALAVLGSIVFVTLMVSIRAYRTEVMSKRLAFIARSFACATLPSIGLLGLGSLVSWGMAMLAFAVSLTAAVLPTRLCIQMLVKWALDTRLISRRAVIAGGGHEAAQLIRGLAKMEYSDIRLVGIFDDRDDIRSPIQVLGLPKLGGYDDLLEFVRASEIDMVIVALPLSAEERIDWLLEQFHVLPVEIRLSACSDDFSFEPSLSGSNRRGFERTFGPDRRLAKRIFDLCFALAALALLWPIMALAALAVRIDSQGPIFFRQQRHGYNNREISVLKFRSMHHEMADPDARQIVSIDDPRITRVGRFLRRSSIDELPQLFNVLSGTLSLVGPRPHAIAAKSSQDVRFTQIVKGYAARHRLPPGITGWAQINGWRGEINSTEKLVARFEHDLYYIENWSVLFDLKILMRTPRALLKSEGAY